MFLSLSFDIAAIGPGTEPIADFRERVARIGAARPDFVILAGEGEGGAFVPPSLEALVDCAWITGKLTDSCVVAGLPALHSVPFHVARALSAIDFLSGGRSGWMAIAGGAERFDAAYGQDLATAAPDEQAARHDDFIRATQALWDSWDDDALIIDKAAGRYLDSGKVRRVDYRGPHYRTMGPLNAARPPQGYPVLVRDGDGMPTSGIVADVVIGELGSLDAAAEPIKLAKVDSSDSERIDAAKAAVSQGRIAGLHLEGPNALAALESLRDGQSSIVEGKRARPALGLAHPANSYREGALS
ncbi:hypothetical protein B2G71_17820 [Novosphingobium sp. PC22D]|uniref:LLM class flavin-dependent oxidoreductase n=1 Tax=Novosphingobium sp. PC22D TaxID=1962403 RepID=UPI000BF1CEF3|nr:LLM class flavin-dependent oxidoreductase [Novosphingobium sp. PC22D]PEQ11409.1 hypothetical protein B2G71_17820 [Novosphingobium sp. PC22D]